MQGFFWLLLCLVVVLWLLGFFVVNVGSLIHLLIVVAVVILIYNFVVYSRGRRL